MVMRMLDKELETREFYEDLGWQVWSWRTGRGMTQQQLADACGVSRSRISLIESGRTHLNFDTFILLAKALGIEPHILLDPKERNNLIRLDADPEIQKIVKELDNFCEQVEKENKKDE